MENQLPPAQPTLTLPRLDPNPIPHLTEGVKNMVRANLKPMIAAIMASVAMPIVLIITAIIAMSRYNNAQLLWDSVRHNFALIAIMSVITSLISICFALALNRVILLGARAERTTFSEAMSFSFSRLLPTIGIYLLLGIALVVPAVLTGLLTWQVSPLWALLFLPLAIAYFAASFFLSPLSFMVVDSRPLGSIVAILKHLQALWKQGFLVLFLYIVCMNFVGGGMGSVSNGFWNLPSGNNSQSTTKTVQSGKTSTAPATEESSEPFKLESIKFDMARWVFGVVSIIVIFIAIISTTMQTFLLAGFAHVYNTVMSRLQPDEHDASPVQ